MPSPHLLSRLLVAVLAFCMVAASGNSATAQPVAEIVADPGSFKENFDSAVPVSGSVIVGVRLGEAEGNVAVQDTQLVLPTATDVCVRVVTRDGRYSANNVYRLPAPVAGANRVRLSPVTLHYAQALSDYKKDDLAICAFAAHNGSCAPAQVAYLPHLADPRQPGQHLNILINSGARYSAVLVRKKQQQVRCQAISQGSKIAYDQKCQIPLEYLSEGPNELTLTMDDGFDEEAVRFQVMLPRNTQ
ncbi:hypothetical protein [Megalodesulfovibrio paquesii]